MSGSDAARAPRHQGSTDRASATASRGHPGWLQLGLIGPALVGCAVLAGLLVQDRLIASDRAVDARIAVQREMLATAARGAAGARAFDGRARDALAGIAEPASRARHALAGLDAAAAPGGQAVPLEAPAQALDDAWLGVESALARATGTVGALAELAEVAERFEAVVARLLVDAARLGDALSTADADPEQIRAATRQLLLAQRLESSSRRLVSDPDGLLGTADRLGRDAIVFGEVNNALLNGNRALRLGRVGDLDARAILERIGRQWREATAAVERIVGLAARGAESGAVLAALDSALARTREALDALASAHAGARAARPFDPGWLRLAVALAVAVLLLASMLSARGRRRAAQQALARRRAEDELTGALAASEAQAVEAELEVARLAASFDALAAGLETWSRGGLAASVRGIEALPPALELAVEKVRGELAPVVEELRECGLELGTLGSTARGAASRVAGMASDQATRMEALARSARSVTASLEPLTARCAEVGGHAARTGGAAAAATVETRAALDAVSGARTAVAETASRVTRASDELGVLRDLAEGLDELSDQSKLLSVNVAIQASMDTESGRALANFADEVQRMSERARQAVRRVEAADTHLRGLLGEAVEAVKRGRWALDSAADRALRARPALETLEQIGADAELLRPALDEVARAHTLQVAEVVRGLKAVQSLAVEIRASAFAASDTSARVEAAAHRGARAAQRLDPDAGESAEILEIGFAAEDAAAVPAGNVRVLRPPEPPAGS